MRSKLFIASMVLVLTAIGAGVSQTHTGTTSGTVVTHGGGHLVLATPEGIRIFTTYEDTRMPAVLESDQVVVVKYDEVEGELVADEILRVDERVTVTERAPDESQAVAGTVKSVGADHLVVEAPSGEEAFVLRPEKLRARPVEPGTNVAVIFRTVSLGGQEQLIATDLVEIPSELTAPQAVAIRYTPIEEPDTRTVTETSGLGETVPAEAPAEAEPPPPAPEAESRLAQAGEPERPERLPQTASILPVLGLLGLLALVAAGAYRLVR